jgi:hypothetical protein
MRSGKDKLGDEKLVDYPIKGRFDQFLLAGGEEEPGLHARGKKEPDFKAIKIEFFGLKIK